MWPKKIGRGYFAATPIQVALLLFYQACSLVRDHAWHLFRQNSSSNPLPSVKIEHLILCCFKVLIDLSV